MKFTDEETQKLFGFEGEVALELALDSLKTRMRSAFPEEPKHTARDFAYLEVDYDTPLEDQFTVLVANNFFRDGCWKGLTSQNFPPLRRGKVKTKLRIRRFGLKFEDRNGLFAAISANTGERPADPYMLVAWLRSIEEEYAGYTPLIKLIAAGQLMNAADGRQMMNEDALIDHRDYAPCVHDVENKTEVYGWWIDLGLDEHTSYLVACE